MASLPEVLCVVAIAVSVAASSVLAVTGVRMIVQNVNAPSSIPYDQREPIVRGDAFKSGDGTPWSPRYPAYKGWPYGQ